MTDNLELWNALGTTDPDQTKRFQRAGGFKGTAVKPIYVHRKMTERFGPCGAGWGIDKPEYQLVNGADGEIAVYCNVTVWHGDRENKVPGVGGDMVVKKFNNGKVVLDDEAFKKAYTDAVGNALKLLGMSADVHMGFHDDDKYVTQLRRDIAEEERRQYGDGEQPASPAEQPQGAAKPTAEQWAAKVHAGPTTDVRELSLPPGKYHGAVLALINHAPAMPSIDRVMEANDGLLQHWSEQDTARHKAVLDAVANRRGFFSQHPTGKAA